MADEIIQELWKIKDDIASNHNYNLKNLVKYLQEKKRGGKYKKVDLLSAKKVSLPIASAVFQAIFFLFCFI